MLTKNWNEYNQDEKSKLLFHVYVYYGKANDIIDHLDEYRKLISTNPDDVLKIYITAKYLNFDPQRAIAKALRENKLKTLFTLTEPIDFSNPDVINTLNKFLDEIVFTYNYENLKNSRFRKTL